MAVTRPSPAALALARSILPVQRVASNSRAPSGFAAMLRAVSMKRSTGTQTVQPRVALKRTETSHAPMLVGGGPAPISRAAILKNRNPDGYGHVRLFDRWANAERTRMYVCEETPPRSVHHVINWVRDARPCGATTSLMPEVVDG